MYTSFLAFLHLEVALKVCFADDDHTNFHDKDRRASLRTGKNTFKLFPLPVGSNLDSKYDCLFELTLSSRSGKFKMFENWSG